MCQVLTSHSTSIHSVHLFPVADLITSRSIHFKSISQLTSEYITVYAFTGALNTPVLDRQAPPRRFYVILVPDTNELTTVWMIQCSYFPVPSSYTGFTMIQQVQLRQVRATKLSYFSNTLHILLIET